jgi:hypothetical protein
MAGEKWADCMTYPIDGDDVHWLTRSVSTPLTREAGRSLWLNRVVAVRVAEDPERAIAIAHENLGRMETAQTDWDEPAAESLAVCA